MNEAYFLTSLTNAINLANSNQINLSKKKLLIITDKISVSNYLKKKILKTLYVLTKNI